MNERAMRELIQKISFPEKDACRGENMLPPHDARLLLLPVCMGEMTTDDDNGFNRDACVAYVGGGGSIERNVVLMG